MKSLEIDKIRLDGNTQSRATINEETVAEYAELWKAANGDCPFPPADVFHDGTDYFCADGFHRLLSAQRAKRVSVPVTIHKGTARDAFLFAAKCNAQHGLRRRNADKRFIVKRFLSDAEWSRNSARWIADACGVSDRFVGEIKKQVRTVRTSNEKVTGQDGKEYPARRQQTVSNPPPAASPPATSPPADVNGSTSPAGAREPIIPVRDRSAEPFASASSTDAEPAKPASTAEPETTVEVGETGTFEPAELYPSPVDIEALAVPYNQALKDLNRMRREFAELASVEKTGGHLNLVITRITRGIGELKATISQSSPTKQCECGGVGCRKCHNTGFLTKGIVEAHK